MHHQSPYHHPAHHQQHQIGSNNALANPFRSPFADFGMSPFGLLGKESLQSRTLDKVLSLLEACFDLVSLTFHENSQFYIQLVFKAPLCITLTIYDQKIVSGSLFFQLFQLFQLFQKKII